MMAGPHPDPLDASIVEGFVAIGALGGSGTRAVAEVLIQAGIDMGDELNRANDNLLFTRLFRNPAWYRQSSPEQKQQRLQLFQKCMQHERLSPGELLELYSAAASNPTFSSDPGFYVRSLKRLLDFGPASAGQTQARWGWKEPNTQIYVGKLLAGFRDLKYIHVLRHGLDMAFSDNQHQLANWGWKYQIALDGTETNDELAIKQLAYWVASTKDVLEQSEKHRERFLLINHTSFCQNPRLEVDRMLRFAGLELPGSTLETLYAIPKDTGSNDRYQDKNLAIFAAEQLRFVRDMGFVI